MMWLDDLYPLEPPISIEAALRSLQGQLAVLALRDRIDPQGQLRELPAMLALKRGCRR